jgi:anti-sigma factor RsiW
MMAGAGAGGHLGDVLSALLDGELLPAHEDAARAHLAVCPDCSRELTAVGQARTWVRALPPVEPPFGFYERMLVDHHPARHRVLSGTGATFASASTPFGAGSTPFGAGVTVPGGRSVSTLRRRAGAAAFGAAAVAVTVLNMGSPTPRPVGPAAPTPVQARATSVSVGADLLSKLAPAGVPGSYRR